MSWFIGYNDKSLFERNEPSTESPIGVSKDESNDQAVAARAVAQSLIESGVVGDASRDFFVNLSGHINPEHAPTEGYANDCVGISITQKS